ncbi:histone acetyltransferase KAT6B [Condylostylus longicornis]|uniref:histone acetyltransferase KAT6B n=1 Tax=Condylostylus longicornis TaxID=2530218 RepID=UPI00244DFE15|nr:histone acetyltransferase KAT6B [Condylostylus longicornis]
MKRLGRPPKSLAKVKPQPIETVSSRVGGRERKAKKVFDPSENNTPKKRIKASKSTERGRNEYLETKFKSRTESKSISPKSKYNGDEYCSICNKEEKKLKLLANCNDCNLKAHIDCLKTKFEDKKLLHVKWRCDNCKTCAICYETEEIGSLITCSVCINSYHITCHIPKVNVKTVNHEDWRCTKCPAPSVSKQTTNPTVQTKPQILKPQTTTAKCNSTPSLSSENSSSSFSSVTAQQSVSKKDTNIVKSAISDTVKTTVKEESSEGSGTETKQNFDKNFQKFDLKEIPDISSWSCEKLSEFMKKIFPYGAKLLREQDIDGQSLLLMTRKDVLSLNLKLGPALRLYNFIVSLQTRKNDSYATWIY